MSGKQTGMVWDLDLPQNLKYVLLAYADHADDDGDRVYPSLAKMAHKTGYSPMQIRRLTRELVKRELMELVEKGHGRGNPNRYRLTLEKGDKTLPFGTKTPAPAKVTPDEEKVTFEPEKGNTQMLPEPSYIEPSVSPTGRQEPLDDMKSFQEKYVRRLYEGLRDRDLLAVRKLSTGYKNRLSGELREHLKTHDRAVLWRALDRIVFRWADEPLELWRAVGDVTGQKNGARNGVSAGPYVTRVPKNYRTG